MGIRDLRAKPVLIIAHRGASAVAPEGTEAAICAAVRAGADMIELDVQLTRDGRMVVFHDARVDRTTNGVGRLDQMRYAQVARLDAGSWFSARHAGQRVLLLSRALALIPRRLWVNLELKRTPRSSLLLERLLRLTRRMKRSNRLLVSSFDRRLLDLVRPSGFSTALISRTRALRSVREAVSLGCAAWHPWYTLVAPRAVAYAHAAGLRVHAWTVDDPLHARRLIRLGVQGIFTNDPSRLRGLTR